jgi:hypothetical protein
VTGPFGVLGFEFWVASDLAGLGTQSQYHLEFAMANLASSLAILKTQNPKLQTQNRSSLHASQISQDL